LNHIHFYLIGTEHEKHRWRQAHPDQYTIPVAYSDPRAALKVINPWDQVIYCDSYFNQITKEHQSFIWSLVQQAKQRGRRVDETASL
jgi:hypothetical protein